MSCHGRSRGAERQDGAVSRGANWQVVGTWCGLAASCGWLKVERHLTAVGYGPWWLEIGAGASVPGGGMRWGCGFHVCAAWARISTARPRYAQEADGCDLLVRVKEASVLICCVPEKAGHGGWK